MNVLVELTSAIDAVCAAEPAQPRRPRVHPGPASPARAAERGHHPGHRRLRGGRHLGGRRCPQRGGVAGDALPHCRCPRPGGACGWGGRCGTWPVPRRPGWRVTIDATHVAALAAARTPASADCFGRDEAMLVDQAARLSHRHFSRALAYWCQRADPDGTEDRASAEFDARRLHLSQSFGGSWVLDGGFDPIGGAVLDRALRRIEAGAVRHRLGRGPGPGGRGGLRRRSGPHPRPAPGRRGGGDGPPGGGDAPRRPAARAVVHRVGGL